MAVYSRGDFIKLTGDTALGALVLTNGIGLLGSCFVYFGDNKEFRQRFDPTAGKLVIQQLVAGVYSTVYQLP